MKSHLKFTSALFLLLSCWTSCVSQSVVNLDVKFGFRDLKFFAKSDSISGLTLLEDGKSTKVYARPADDLNIGERVLKSIVYFFYKGRLSDVLIETKGYLNSRAALAAFQSVYGRGTQANEYIETYFWEGDRVKAFYDENSSSHDARLIISCKALKEEQDDDKARETREAGKKF